MGIRIAPPSVNSWGRLIVIGLVAVSLQWAWHERPETRTDGQLDSPAKAHPLVPLHTGIGADATRAADTHTEPSSTAAVSATAQPLLRHARFYRAKPSREARQVADWVVATHDNGNAPIFIVDKKAARLYVFDAGGRLRGSSTVLLGLARGDDTVPGIGNKKLSQIKPWERTTPAGRFVGELGNNAHGKDVVWVDYDNGVSMHRVITNNPKEHRLARLASAKLTDKRISYGCINVPARFFDASVRPALFGHKAMIYVLPDTKPLRQVFPVDASGTPEKFRRLPTTMS